MLRERLHKYPGPTGAGGGYPVIAARQGDQQVHPAAIPCTRGAGLLCGVALGGPMPGRAVWIGVLTVGAGPAIGLRTPAVARPGRDAVSADRCPCPTVIAGTVT